MRGKAAVMKPTKEELQAHYDSGLSTLQIAPIYGVTDGTLCHWARDLGVERKAVMKERLKRARELRKDGFSYDDIATKTGMSHGWVSKNLGTSTLGRPIDNEDHHVSVVVTHFPEVPERHNITDSWVGLLAERVVYQAILDLWSGTYLEQTTAIEFFSSGAYAAWVWLAGCKPEDVYLDARTVTRRERRPRGAGEPKNFGLRLA